METTTMQRTTPTIGALALVVALLTSCTPADDCGQAASRYPTPVAQAAPERPSGGSSGGRSSTSRSSGSKTKPSKPKVRQSTGSTGGSHGHGPCDDD
ncbi:hypothetical protein [Streptomyces sp. NPDC007117]|uniref:hypothetical protein n=1 Tax=Streptomyces sp. NPDC007117 TaxID=3154314 RepID=UPI00340F0817